MEKWQERLIPRRFGIKELEQGETELTDEGDPVALAQAQEVARCTRELLVMQGWCLWKCSTLSGDIIAVVLDEDVQEVPEGYPIYTVGELEELCQDDISDSTLRLVQEAKKLAGAKVTTEVAKRGGDSWRSWN